MKKEEIKKKTTQAFNGFFSLSKERLREHIRSDENQEDVKKMISFLEKHQKDNL
jgi:hypothetical protein